MDRNNYIPAVSGRSGTSELRLERKSGELRSRPTGVIFCNIYDVLKFIFGLSLSMNDKFAILSLFIYCLCLINCHVECASIQARGDDFSNARMMNYLNRYGYLSDSNPFSANLRTSDALKNAIKEMQRFGGINETGVVDSATIHLMNSKRCGVPDVTGLHNRVKRYTLQGQKWQSTRVTWSVKRWKRRLNQEKARRQFKKALQIWSKHSNLTFHEVRHSDADIVISFFTGRHNDGYNFDGKGNILAHAFFPGKGREGDTHFDSDEDWVLYEPKPDSDEVSLFAVAAHEFGHSLGLSHSSVPGALMFPYYNGFKETDELPRDDIIGIQQLYGSRYPIAWGPLKPSYPKIIPIKPRPTIPTKRPIGPIKPTRTNSIDEKNPPITCKTTIDAISTVRTELFVFKDKYFWRINSRNTLVTSYPILIHRFWSGFPKNLTHIDAFYERPTDHKIVFFSGRKYWVFNSIRVMPGYPKTLTDLGIPKSVKKIDAAMVWGQNGKTYLFSGKQYWRFSEEDGRVEYDYPRHTRVWGGIPADVDAAFQWSDGKTYFFKDHFFWPFNDKKMHVDSFGPQQITAFWFNCKKDKNLPLPRPKITHSKNRIYDQLYGIDENSSTPPIYCSSSSILYLTAFNLILSYDRRISIFY